MARRGKRESSHADGIGPVRLVGLAFVAAVALVFGWALIQFLSPQGLQIGARKTGNSPIEGVLLHTDARTLTVSFTGNNPATTFDSPCWAGYEIVTTQDPATVRLELKRLNHAISAGRETYACGGIGHRLFETVELDQPLAGRAIVEGASGAPISPFVATNLLTLDPIPDGWSLVGSNGTPNRWTRTWANGPDNREVPQPLPELITVAQDTMTHPSGTAPPGPPPIAVTVRGKAGTLEGDPLNRALRWDERGANVSVQATHAGPAGVRPTSFTDDELLAVAERLV